MVITRLFQPSVFSALLDGAAVATMTPVIRGALALAVVADSDVRAIAIYFSDMDHAAARASSVEATVREVLATSDLAIGQPYDAEADLYASACVSCHYNSGPAPLSRATGAGAQ